MFRAYLIVPLLLVTGCIPDVMNTKPEVRGLEGAAPIQTLFNPEAKSEVTLRPGGELIVRLASNLTTGYYWVQTAGDDAVVAQVSEGYTADPAPEGIAGSGGMQEFQFEGLAKGKTTLVLRYQRSSEGPAEQREIAVKVVE